VSCAIIVFKQLSIFLSQFLNKKPYISITTPPHHSSHELHPCYPEMSIFITLFAFIARLALPPPPPDPEAPIELQPLPPITYPGAQRSLDSVTPVTNPSYLPAGSICAVHYLITSFHSSTRSASHIQFWFIHNEPTVALGVGLPIMLHDPQADI
jgi:hypothetical protein